MVVEMSWRLKATPPFGNARDKPPLQSGRSLRGPDRRVEGKKRLVGALARSPSARHPTAETLQSGTASSNWAGTYAI